MHLLRSEGECYQVLPKRALLCIPDLEVLPVSIAFSEKYLEATRVS